MCRVFAVSAVTAASSSSVADVVRPSVFGSLPSRTLECVSSPLCATRENCGDAPWGRGSQRSVPSRGLAVSTPYADCAVSTRSGFGSSSVMARWAPARRSGSSDFSRAGSGISSGGCGVLTSSTLRDGWASLRSCRRPWFSYESTARGNAAARNAVSRTSTPNARAAPGAVRSRVLTHGATVRRAWPSGLLERGFISCPPCGAESPRGPRDAGR
ncbi:hypothetical protein RKD22_002883 [Streptomyces pristinaespiralis]